MTFVAQLSATVKLANWLQQQRDFELAASAERAKAAETLLRAGEVVDEQKLAEAHVASLKRLRERLAAATKGLSRANSASALPAVSTADAFERTLNGASPSQRSRGRHGKGAKKHAHRGGALLEVDSNGQPKKPLVHVETHAHTKAHSHAHAAAKTAKHGAKKHGGVDLAKVHLKSFEEVERADLAGVEFTAAYAADEANVARMRSTVASVLLALSQVL